MTNRDAVTDARSYDSALQPWGNGYGVIEHVRETRERILDLAVRLVERDAAESIDWVAKKLIAADRLASAGMWVVAHMTYARSVDLSGRPLASNDFKVVPEGHTGGSLNMVPAYVGYLLANILNRAGFAGGCFV